MIFEVVKTTGTNQNHDAPPAASSERAATSPEKYLRDDLNVALVERNEANLPALTAEGKVYAKLMSEVSRIIFEGAQTFTGYRDMLAKFLSYMESNASCSLLELTSEQQQGYREILHDIVRDSVEKFRHLYAEDIFRQKPEAEVESLKKQLKRAASQVASAYAPRIVLLMKPELQTLENATQELKRMKEAGRVQHLHQMIDVVLEYSDQPFSAEYLDIMTQLVHDTSHNGVSRYLGRLEEQDKTDLLAVINKSKAGPNSESDSVDIKTLYMVLAAVHEGWASAQALLDKPETVKDQNTTEMKRIDRGVYTEFPIVKVRRFQEAIVEMSIDKLRAKHEDNIANELQKELDELKKRELLMTPELFQKASDALVSSDIHLGSEDLQTAHAVANLEISKDLIYLKLE